MKFSKKTAHRLLMFLGMFAPIAYLFGSMFFGLAGAHGEEIYKDDVIIQNYDYDYLMQPDNFRYSAFDWQNEHGRRLGFSLCNLSSSYSEDNPFSSYFGVSANGISFSGTFEFYNYGLGFAGQLEEGYVTFDWSGIYNDSDAIFLDEDLAYVIYDSWYFPFYVISPDAPSDLVVYIFEGNGFDFFASSCWYSNGAWDSINRVSTTEIRDTPVPFGNTEIYFDDGSHLPQGVEWDDELRSYFVPSVKAVSSDTYTASVFGQFFPRDNFLQKIGENALSETPVGFAPFSAMFRYLDSSVFHGSNSQIALMVYGEIYWALHVVMADLVYHVLVWIPNLINRVFDWFDSKGLSDE